MTSIARPHGLGCAEFPAPLQELSPVGISVTNALAVDGIDIKSEPDVVAGIPAMRSPGQGGDAKGITPLGKITHRPEHPRIELHRSAWSGSV